MRGRRGLPAALGLALLLAAAPGAAADPVVPPAGSAATSTTAPTTPATTSPDTTTALGVLASSADLQARADALRAAVEAAEDRVEEAAETHEQVAGELTALVSDQVRAQAALTTAQQALDARRAVAGARARAAAHDGGGRLGLVLGVLRGHDPGDVLAGYQAVGALVGDDARDVAAARAALDAADTAASRAEALRDRQLALEAQATRAQDDAEAALAERSALLAAADASVVSLETAEREQAEARATATAATDLAALGADTSAPAPTAAAATAIAAARTRLGDPYVWGATGPDAFDCSGLVQWAYAQAGVALPRTTRQLYAALPQVPLDQLAPGDLVLYASDDSDASTIHHVGLYLGGGLMVHAPHTGDVVRIAAVTRETVFAAVRPSPGSAP